MRDAARRRARRIAASLLLLALAAPGCRAYDARYWSFPLNSMQIVENGAYYGWSFRKSVGVELASQIFPWGWVESLVDLALFPLTGLHDLYVLTTGRGESEPYEEQVRDVKRHGARDEPRPLTPNEAATHVSPGIRQEHLPGPSMAPAR